MKKFLQVIGVLFGILFLIIYSILLSITPILISSSLVLSDRNNVKEWVGNSGIYEEISDQIKEGVKSNVDVQSINKIADELFTTEYIKVNFEGVIDTFYDFLQGKTDSLEFTTSKLDIESVIEKYIPKEQIDAIKLIGSLKPCTTEQAYKYQQQGGFTSIDDLCIPQGYDTIKLVDESYQKEIIGQQLDNYELSLQQLNLTQQDLLKIRIMATILFYSYIIIPIILLTILGLYLICFPKGTFKLFFASIITILIGVVNIFLSRLSGFLIGIINSFILNEILKESPISSEVIQNIIKSIVTDLFSIYLYISIGITILGVIQLIIGIIIKVVKKKNENHNSKSDHSPSQPPA